MNKSVWIIIAIVGALLVSAMFSYNTLVGMNENVTGKWSQIENQLQRRGDLIPNLVNTVKGYAAHEQQAIQSVADARAKLAGAQGPAGKAAADGELSSALSRLLMVAENYPNLKADANFRALMDELSGTENRIAVARKDYNDAVQVYNVKIRSLPTSLFAGMMGFGPKEYFTAEESAKQVPQVNF
ncbi:LemA family protein [Sporomusa sphaeroides]|uniref:LemA family protein n=2 Tax=Sporomusa TaxID=2375 RepID=A0ABM9W121_9FIRM|nr:LemA family protein [Sporomusa sphaeroides]OLS58135.1 LemA family protein [Sporomusa sphaeroides DSM 2875]CVK17678.1 LemA family protein [Sporomusa sphaeroides DSM 2875]SCM80485.1 Protein LemA [uncultured Sporomusa sp.]